MGTRIARSIRNSMPKIHTKYFQDLDYEEESLFHFPAGIPGFEDERHFLFIEQPLTKPLMFMQSATREDLCFPALPVQMVELAYRLNICTEDLELLELAADRQPAPGVDVMCFVLVCLTENAPPTVNLLSPVVVNLRSRKAVQAIQIDTDYSYQQELTGVAQEASCS